MHINISERTLFCVCVSTGLNGNRSPNSSFSTSPEDSRASYLGSGAGERALADLGDSISSARARSGALL